MTPMKLWIKKIICKYITKKHKYIFGGTYWEGQGRWKSKVHVQRCEHCGHYKKIWV